MVTYEERFENEKKQLCSRKKKNELCVQRREVWHVRTDMNNGDIRISGSDLSRKLAVKPKKSSYAQECDIIQKCVGSDDEDYVLDPDEAARIAQEDAELDEEFERYANGEISDIPQRLILGYGDSDCYGGQESISRVEIEMSGSRSEDKRRARNELQSRGTIIQSEAGYDWHHIPNNGIPRGGSWSVIWFC